MDAISTVALAAGLGWASGMRLYAVLFFLGVIHHAGAAALPASLQVLAHPAVMTVSGALFAIEFFVDKLPGFDTLWDAVHTFVRIPAGALLAAYAISADDPGLALAAGLLGGAVAAGTHLAKAGGRAFLNASPEPFSNWAASLTEDFSALAIVWLALKYPLLLLAALVVFLAAALWLIPKLWRGIKRLVEAIRRIPRSGLHRGGAETQSKAE
ncbi:MAG TPA: DUF4126 domain-containing protein [Burkholderiales bacterium]|jgi:hypothetical protein|nr:DUF4126 domain-containing protein [Burkholderiales bacterium]